MVDANTREIGRNYNISLQERNELVKLAERYLGYHSLFVWNANINGIIIQLRTNDSHLDDFWRENWFPAAYDHNLRPHGVIYAVSGISDTEPWVYYNSETKTGIVFNADSYERIRSLALGMVMDISEEQKAIHFLRGSLVDVNGEGVAIMGPQGSGKSTHTFLLLQLDRARIHSNDWIYVEHLGGEKGRISTLVSERKFYIKTDVCQISPRLKEIFNKCKKEDSYFILDPWWMGGEEKFVDTTRIKVIFLLSPDPKSSILAERLDAEKAMNLLANNALPFLNPHLLVSNEEKRALQVAFFKDILQFAPCYSLNTALPVLDVQKRMREIILSREYTQPSRELKEEVITFEQVGGPPVRLDLIKKSIADLLHRPNVLSLSSEQIRETAEQYGTKTKFGNYNFVSTVKNRSAALTVYIGTPSVVQSKLNSRQREIIRNLPRIMEDVGEYLKKAPLVRVERTMGDNSDFTPKCTLLVSTHKEEMIRLAHMVGQTLFNPRDGKGPQLYVIYIPEWQEKDRQILVFPEIGVTIVLGSDYYGEAKKGFLRKAMWFAKQEGMLGVHAGAKIIRARDQEGKIRKYGMILFGLTATGKTTHSCHNHGLVEEGEGIEIVQDDVVFLRQDGSALGTERGFYIKTDALDPEIQPILYHAATQRHTIFENVMVDYLGNVDFEDEVLTGNGRAIIQRDDLGEYKSQSVNLPPVSEVDGFIVAFITRRNTVVPIVSKLTAEQAAAAFMLGESIETSGSDPKKAGESVREVGTNPFIIGDYAQEGNIFYQFVKSHPDKIQCYLLNTGGVGEIREEAEDGTKVVKQKVLRVEIPEMAAIIRGIARGTIQWEPEPYFGIFVPKRIEGVDLGKFDLSRFYPQELIDQYVKDLRKERIEYLEGFEGLDPAIVKSMKL